MIHAHFGISKHLVSGEFEKMLVRFNPGSLPGAPSDGGEFSPPRIEVVRRIVPDPAPAIAKCSSQLIETFLKEDLREPWPTQDPRKSGV